MNTARSMIVGVLVGAVFAFIALIALCTPKRAQAATARAKPNPAPEAERVRAFNVSVFLWAIAQVETGNDARKVGAAGERGRCQFLRTVWRSYTAEDFAKASQDNGFTRTIERAHVDYLVRRLFPVGEPAPALLAAAWRHGPGAAVNHVRSDYAVRVANLYWEKEAAR